MKKFIALVLAMLMVVSCVCIVSAEDATTTTTKTLYECLGGKVGKLNYEVKTNVLAKSSNATTYAGLIDVYASDDARSYDLKAVVDMSGVKNLVALSKAKAEKKGYTGTFDDLKVSGKFTVTVTLPEGVTVPDLTAKAEGEAKAAFTYDVADILTVGTPEFNKDEKTITVDVTVNEGATAEDIDEFDKEFALFINGITVKGLGSFEFTGTMTGSTTIKETTTEGEGEEAKTVDTEVYVINYTAVDDADDDNTPTLVIKHKKKTSSSSTGNSITPSTSTKKDDTDSKKDDKKDENTSSSSKVEVSTSGSTATVKDVTSDTIKDEKEITIDTTDSKKEIDTVKIGTDSVKNIAESDVEKVEIKLSDATVTVSDEAINEISEKAEGKDVEITVNTEAKLNDKQSEAVKELGDVKTVEASIKSDNKEISGTVTVSTGYEAKENEIVLAATVDEEGNVENIPVSYKDGKVEFDAEAGSSVVVWSVPAEKAFVLTIDKHEAGVFGKEEKNDVAPKIVKDRTMLPARFVAEKLGATVEWDAEKQEVTVKKDDITIVITIGSVDAKINGEDVKLDSEAFIENDRTYTPIRFIAEALGAKVDWNGATSQVVITK